MGSPRITIGWLPVSDSDKALLLAVGDYHINRIGAIGLVTINPRLLYPTGDRLPLAKPVPALGYYFPLEGPASIFHQQNNEVCN
jgi:hypothetical protein